MPLSWGETERGQVLRWGLLAVLVYVILYFLPLGPSFAIQGSAELHGDIHLLLGMRFFNVLMFGLTAVMTYVLADDIFGDERVGILAALMVIASPLANHAIIAWTHVPAAFFVLLAFIAYRRFLESDGTKWLVAVAASAALVFTMKYPDVVLLLPILAHMGLLVVRDGRYDIVRKSVVPLALIVLILLPTLAFHYSSFGSVFTTPYHMRPHALPPNDKPNIAVTFDPARLVQTVPSMLLFFDPGMQMLQRDVEDFDYKEYKSALFQSAPSLVLGVFGFLIAWRREDNPTFTTLTASGTASLVLLYGSWIYFSGGWTTNMRYLTPAIPFLAVFGAYAVAESGVNWCRLARTGGASAIAVFLLLSVYALSAKPLGAKATMNLVSFVSVAALTGAFLLTWRWRDDQSRRVFYAALGAALGIAGVMAFVLDNLLLFNGSAESVLLLNVDQSLFLGIVLATVIAAGVLKAFDYTQKRGGGSIFSALEDIRSYF